MRVTTLYGTVFHCTMYFTRCNVLYCVALHCIPFYLYVVGRPSFSVKSIVVL